MAVAEAPDRDPWGPCQGTLSAEIRSSRADVLASSPPQPHYSRFYPKTLPKDAFRQSRVQWALGYLLNGQTNG